MWTIRRRAELVGMMGFLAAALLMAPSLRAQQFHGLPSVNMQSPIVQADPELSPDTPEGRLLLAKRFKALNEMRQKTMVADANKLLKLAQELNADNGKAISPSERIKKLAEIEKLAKSVREKMSYAIGVNPGPDLSSPFSPTTP